MPKFNPSIYAMEFAVAAHFDYRRNIIVPNISWGLRFNHELDVLVVTPSGWAYEVEIKLSRGDLKADALKPHGHKSKRIKRLYFAVPDWLAMDQSLFPDNAGILSLGEQKRRIEIVRMPIPNKDARKFTEEERLELYRLATMRIWTLKRHLDFRLKRAGHIDA